MNKKVLILLIPMIMLSITSFANNVVDNTITKTIEIKEVNENQISIDEKIEYLGESFLLSDVNKEKIAKPTKKIEEKKELELTTDNKEEVLSNFSKILQYNDDEYEGELKLIEDSLEIKTINNGTYEKVYTINKEYNNLENNDLINIPKEIMNTSIIYILTHCDWNISETIDIDNITIPKKYTAKATYKGIKTLEYPYTYNCIVTYSGDLIKKDYNDLKYTLIYTKDIKEKTSILPILGSTGVFILFIFLIFPNAKIQNYVDGNYRTLRYIKVFKRNPKVNLKYFPNAKTNAFNIEFSNNISEKLKGQFISIETPKGTINKMIINNSIEVNI